MLAVLGGPPANPSSAHREGARARRLLEEARAAVAGLIGGRAGEITLTSGATEANNLALRGALAAAGSRDGLVVSAIEHASVLDTAQALAAAGARATVVPVDTCGRVDPDRVAAACDERTAVVSIGLANGEIGTLAPIARIATSPRARHRPHTTPRRPPTVSVDVAASASTCCHRRATARDLRAPARSGAAAASAAPARHRRPQERGLRAGTEAVAALAGFGAGRARGGGDLPQAEARMAALLDRLWRGSSVRCLDVVRHGPAAGPRLPNTLNLRVPGCAGESLLVLLDLAGVAVSLGSACAAGAPEPSHVLRAIGLDEEAARCGLRLSLGPDTTAAEVDAVVDLLPRLVHQIRVTSHTEVA